MKKFIFTAIAMVAFVGSSMANTIELGNQKEVIDNKDTCERIALAACMAVLATNGTNTSAAAAGAAAYTTCIRLLTPVKTQTIK